MVKSNGLIDKIVSFVSNLVSSKKIFLYIFSFTMIWIVWNRYSPIDRFDQPLSGYPNLVLIYTIYFGLVEGIMKVVQGQQQRSDDSRKEVLDQILKETHSQTKVIHNLVKIQLVLGKKTLEILETYSRKREEDELQEERTKENEVRSKSNEDRLDKIEQSDELIK